MNLLILGGPSLPQRAPNLCYRGTFRRHPYHFDALSEDHEFNQLFYWFLDEGGETGVVHDLSKAVSLVEAIGSYSVEKGFEVVEVNVGKQSPATNDIFLGYDLSHGFSNSLLWRGLKSHMSADNLPHIGVLCLLQEEFFRPQLNQYGLFSDFETASFCLRSMQALQSFHEGLYEGESIEVFRIVSVHLIRRT